LIIEFPAITSKVLAVFHDNKRVESLDLNSHGAVILQECQFYAEEGGQKYDKGFLEINGGKEYPAVVRVARVGDNLDDACAVECCSGTHVLSTSSIMDFTVLSDRSSAKGVRRIFALTGEKARKSREYGREIISRLESVAEDFSNDSLNEEIDWSQMPYEDNAQARKLLKVIKKKRKVKKEIKC
ncbi:threonine/alanine tRNA ligase second additional domain protein, partial [Oesophagostomum dentatum]